MVSRMSGRDGAVLSVLADALAARGINVIGAASVDAYDATLPASRTLGQLMPGARTAIVLGNGGGDLWSRFRDFCRAHPDHEAAPDPLDRYTQLVIDDATARVFGDVPARVVYPFRFPAEPVSFMRLASVAGLGRPSLVGVLVHPVYGPWIALRAAILVPLVLTAPRPADGFDPCPTCRERACIAACPAGAVQPAGWDIPRCATHRGGVVDPCAGRCHARVDCVLGREHRYPDDALAYHQSRARDAVLAFAPRRR